MKVRTKAIELLEQRCSNHCWVLLEFKLRLMLDLLLRCLKLKERMLLFFSGFLSFGPKKAAILSLFTLKLKLLMPLIFVAEAFLSWNIVISFKKDSGFLRVVQKLKPRIRCFSLSRLQLSTSTETLCSWIGEKLRFSSIFKEKFKLSWENVLFSSLLLIYGSLQNNIINKLWAFS